MSKIFISFFLLLFPFSAFAHGGESMMNLDEIKTVPEMMRYLEDQALGETLHEEMEDLMTAMIKGSLTATGTEEIVKLMKEHPGPYGMMMGRMLAPQKLGNSTVGIARNMVDMMSGWGFGQGNAFWSGVLGLLYVVWLVVGVLAIIWLLQQVNKKK